MINYARNCNSDERISYIVLDIETSHLPNDEIEKYHNAVSFYCLHWCNDIWYIYIYIFNIFFTRYDNPFANRELITLLSWKKITYENNRVILY